MIISLKDFPILSTKVEWGRITTQFTLEAVEDEALISNISIVPVIGDRYVMMKLDTGVWELAGGTLKRDEPYLDALRREVQEELGAELIAYHVLGHFRCSSRAEQPYLPHIPHPDFIRLVGYGEVRLIGEPLNPPDGEKVILVDVVGIEEAIRRFEEINRRDLSELYRLVHLTRTSEKQNVSDTINGIKL
ncbi:NUDIX hydrolase [Paenibacillus mendelii]|uniref:NUDIX hydrolase n=1 Tax=Paenibacillus mendelii TaxID=206163 RepID=A0ABV6J7A4_9BACL|nr:NUDIX hydrolase [Paenibacillus mendelii]MCQ6562112.1 NUDIX hydrolase [Paenibacillus mendelii]